MGLIVQKYGGSSLATPQHIQWAAQRIERIKRSGSDLVVVVSAMGKTTDHLIRLARKTVHHPPVRELDMLLTAGERVSMALLSMALQERGISAISFTGSQSGIVTSPHHTEAKIIDIRAHRIREELCNGKVVIIAGFQGVSEQHEITTLGRGGSDTTAVAIAAALGAECCEILTDVDGLFSADPRLVANARLLENCSYDEALELASLGAKMHSRSIELAKKYQVRVRVAGARTDCVGTYLVHSLTTDGGTMEKTMEKTIIRGIAMKRGYHFFKVDSSLDSLMDVLEQNRVPLRFFNYSEQQVRFLCEQNKVPLVRELLKEQSGDFEEVAKVAIVSAVGDGLSSSSEILPLFLKTIRETGAKCLLLCSNSLSMTAAVEFEYQEEVTKKLHEKLLEKDGKGFTLEKR